VKIIFSPSYIRKYNLLEPATTTEKKGLSTFRKTIVRAFMANQRIKVEIANMKFKSPIPVKNSGSE